MLNLCQVSLLLLSFAELHVGLVVLWTLREAVRR